MTDKHPLYGVLLILGYILSSVLAYLSFKYIFIHNPEVTPLNAILWGFIGTLFISGLFIGTQKKERTRLNQEWINHKKLIITIALISSLGSILWTWSLKLANAGTVGLIGRADLLMAIALGSIFLGERFSWKTITGAIIAIAGLITVVNLPNEISLFAVGIVLLTRFIYAIQSFLVKKSGQKLKGIPFAFLRLAIMTLCIFIITISTETLTLPPLWPLLMLIGSQLFGVYIGRIFYFEAHKYLGIGHINLLSLAQPPLLLAATWLLLNEAMPTQKIIGGIILLLGLSIIVLEKSQLNKKFSLTRLFAKLRAKNYDTTNPNDLT